MSEPRTIEQAEERIKELESLLDSLLDDLVGFPSWPPLSKLQSGEIDDMVRAICKVHTPDPHRD